MAKKTALLDAPTLGNVAPAGSEEAAQAADPLLAGFTHSDLRVDPMTLAANPDNVRDHPAEQLASLRESIRRNGWVKPLVVNTRNGRLVDGHARLQIALEDRLAHVPVNYGTWTEAQHAELAAILDAIGAQATINPRRFAALKAKLTLTAGSPLDRLRNALETDDFFRRGAGAATVLLGQAPAPVGSPPLVADPDPEAPAGPAASPPPAAANGHAPADPDDAGPAAPPPSHVRMYQLFLDAATFDEFLGLVDRLRERFGTDNATDTVLAALRAVGDAA
jgi:hypothetical protein